ncbi:hypothetical protein [Methanoculleus sp. UBA416]|jgi:hypothetical protein|uniref:hypothetical protein n=1 Tax=Methanoculleus sp. UBA416 TaxID=1915510 RepID=UPI00319E421D
MEIRTTGNVLATLFIAGVLLVVGCVLLPPSGDDQTGVDAYPRCPLTIMPPIHYQGSTVNESDMAVTVLVLNLTIAPEAMASSNPELDPAVNLTPVHISYSDTHDLYTLKPGEYSTAWHESGDGDDMLEPGEVVELTLPLQQPIPANTRVSADFATFYRGTLVLLFCTPDVIESSGQILEFTAEPFVPH